MGGPRIYHTVVVQIEGGPRPLIGNMIANWKQLFICPGGRLGGLPGGGVCPWAPVTRDCTSGHCCPMEREQHTTWQGAAGDTPPAHDLDLDTIDHSHEGISSMTISAIPLVQIVDRSALGRSIRDHGAHNTETLFAPIRSGAAVSSSRTFIHHRRRRPGGHADWFASDCL